MRFRRAAKEKAIIPTASMADIAFLLIIFFMVTTVHELDRTSVNLPLGKIRVEAEKGAAIVVLGKKVEMSGEEILQYKFSNGETQSTLVQSPEDIYLEASRITYRDKTHQFILKADGSVRFEKVDELLDAMRRGGVQKVLLLTAQQTEDG
ncbi:MAG: biopolymer transporter ExbD [bacterium]|nr:biopolymer transporter ExbD [bacterium]